MKPAPLLALLFATSCTNRAVAPVIAPVAIAPIPMITADQILSRLEQDKAANKVAVMHLWATWCAPCVDEFPHLVKIQRDLLASDATVDFFAVSVDEPADKDAVASFVARSGAAFPVFLADAPDHARFAYAIDPTWRAVLPTTFFFGQHGQERVMAAIGTQSEFKAKIEAARSR